MEVRQAPLEVEEVSYSEVVLCAPSEEIRGVFQYPGEGAMEGWVVFGQHVARSMRLVSRS